MEDRAQAREAGAEQAQAREAGAEQAQAREAGAEQAEAREAGAEQAEVREAGAEQAEAREADAARARVREAGAEQAEAREADAARAEVREAGAEQAEAREAGAEQAEVREAGADQAEAREADAARARVLALAVIACVPRVEQGLRIKGVRPVCRCLARTAGLSCSGDDDMVIAVASGKGGTGKTTIAVNLAYAIGNAQVVDCDVEEPNAHLFLCPEIHETEPVGIPVPVVDESLCNGCGTCGEVCEFSAIVVIKNKVMVFPELCHGCGACAYFCPRKAIREELREIGRVERGSAGTLSFVHGLLNVGEPMAPPLIRKTKKSIDRERAVIIDAPPGTSCPVVESVKGADFCVLVTEPTPFGLNDLTLAVEMVRKLGVPIGVVINSCTIGNSEVEDYCGRERIPVLMRLPWDRRIAEQYSAGRLLLKNLPEYAEHFTALYQSIHTEMAAYEATHCHQR